MKKSTLVALSILGALAMPVMGLAQPYTTVSTFNNTSKKDVTVNYYQFQNATQGNALTKKCINGDKIKAGAKQILFGGASGGGTASGCGNTANITAIMVNNPTDSTKAWIVCTGANMTHKTIGENFSNFLNFSLSDGPVLTADTPPSPKNIPKIAPCSGDTCAAQIQACATFPDPTDN